MTQPFYPPAPHAASHTAEGSDPIPGGGGGAGYGGTSVTSLAIGTGSKAFTTQAGLAYVVGSRVRAASAGDPTKWMEGLCTAYSGTTLTVLVDLVSGSGTLADWNLSLAGEPASGPTVVSDSMTLTNEQLWVIGDTPVPFPNIPLPGAGYMWLVLSGMLNNILGEFRFQRSAMRLGPAAGLHQEGAYYDARIGDEAQVFRRSSDDGPLAPAYLDNQPLAVGAEVNLDAGPIATHQLATGGADYEVGDTGTINDSGSATYEVVTVDGGAVLTYTLTGPGDEYLVAAGALTTPTLGIGAGFAIDILTVNKGDGAILVSVVAVKVPLA